MMTAAPRPIDRLLLPFVTLAHHAMAGSALLVASTVLALAVANSGWGSAYDAFWQRSLPLSLGDATLAMTHLQWVNDAGMALFFLVVGLEIKRELTVGTLATPRAAALPIAGAIGGMLAPALLYVAFNAGTPTASGWGVPMATDIVFALGLLALVAPGVPPAVRAFLGALAIVDDLGAILVIGLFYSHGLSASALAAAAGITLLLLVLNRLGVQRPSVYLLIGIPLWFAVHAAGVHATIAGVILALAIPGRRAEQSGAALAAARQALSDAEDEVESLSKRDASEGIEQVALENLRDAYERLQPTSWRVERGVHHWVSFLILPIFVFANAGVRVDVDGVRLLGSAPALGIMIGLVLGKPLGITAACWLAERVGIAMRPEGMGWRQLAAAGALAGIGFTMAIFIGALAFEDPAIQEVAKMAVLAASGLAALIGGVAMRRSLAPGSVDAAMVPTPAGRHV